MANRFVDALWPKLEDPLVELVVHLMVTILAVLSIAIIGELLYVLGLDGKAIPGTRLVLNTEVTLGEWMFVLEVVAATVIIVVGVCRAILSLARS